uniref:Uncharacterized protein n=1 Tax=Rhizophora mucronata TaxID=61149 RepID=A0A2P2QSE3_RHIMU
MMNFGQQGETIFEELAKTRYMLFLFFSVFIYWCLC